MYEIYCKLRDERGLKDADVVRETKITKSTFSDWKSGRSNPKQEKLQKIADFFGVTVNYLMTGESPVEDEYYTNPETARMAQEMFEDPDMRSLLDMKRNMEPDKFKAHVNFMRELYRKEHPEDDGL